jgi:hypothetical protein
LASAWTALPTTVLSSAADAIVILLLLVSLCLIVVAALNEFSRLKIDLDGIHIVRRDNFVTRKIRSPLPLQLPVSIGKNQTTDWPATPRPFTY